MSKIQVKNAKIVDLSPKIKDPKFADLMPKTLHPQRYSFEVLGVSNAIANGLRRTIASECLVKALHIEFDDFSTNNPFCLNDMVLNRLKLIPLDQNCPLDATFELDVINRSRNTIDVKSGEIKIKGPASLKKNPFNETFTLFTLEPSKYTKISKISVVEGFGYNHAGHTFAINVTKVALDQVPIDYNDPNSKGISSSIADPQHHLIAFNTNGTCPPARVVSIACDNLISRLEYINNLLPNIVSSDDIYALTIIGESHTIGCILMKTIYDLYPQIPAVTYQPDSVIRSVTIKIRTDDEINEVFRRAIKHAVGQYAEIKKAFA